jgi:predicted metal-dependent phosphoesterase TrpH
MSHEIVGNLHMHTPYSDGEGSHDEIALAAEKAGLDFVAVTDHNVWVDEIQGYHHNVLVLIGEEVHNPRRQPQVNHSLIYGAEDEMCIYAAQPQKLIEETHKRGGLLFIAHPFDYPLNFMHEPGIPWIDWEVSGYNGIEIWNYMSEFKRRLPNKLMTLYYAFHPEKAIRGPFKESLRLWDDLLASGKHVVGFGGADAHAAPMSLGPFKRVIFPYEYLFRCVNMHLMIDTPLIQEVDRDKRIIYQALQDGRGWVGYDLIGSTKGFRYVARSGSLQTETGGEIRRAGAINFEVQTPLPATIQIIKAGKGIVGRSEGSVLKFTTAEAGVYRAEAYRSGKGWIFSNPIYVL